MSLAATTTVLALGFSCMTLAQIPTNGLVADYPFNGSATDASGNGNDGTVHAATLTSDRFSSPNSAYSFDGTGSHISVSENPGLESNALSISFWIKAARYCASGAVRSDIISKDNQSGRQWTSQLEQTGKIRTATFTTTSEYTFDSETSIELNRWYHVVRVWDGATCSIYIDNVLRGSMLTPGNLRTGSAPVEIGGSSAQYFQGLLDDIRIYSRSLSAAEVSSLYYEAGLSSGLVA